MTIEHILFVSQLKLRLGLFRSDVRLLWRSLYRTRLFFGCILFGLLVALCTAGLLTLASHLV